VTATAVLTAAHVVAGGEQIRVRFDAGLESERSARARVAWQHPETDLAVLTIDVPGADRETVPDTRFGRLDDRRAVVTVHAAGFPRWKQRSRDNGTVYRELHDVVGTVAVLSNRRTGTLEITTSPPGEGVGRAESPWEGMSGAAVWAGRHIIGVVTEQYRREGPHRITAARLDRCLSRLTQSQRDELLALVMPGGFQLTDVTPLPSGWRIRSGYVEQVRDIAPFGGLVDRDAELDELATFCAGEEPYVWWQGGPWAGKSALMSTFVLNPPQGVDIVSFFVTARLAAQADSAAFTDALLDQLAALVGETLPPALNALARESARRALLRDALDKVDEAGRRLVLVVDGLDEDRGAVPGSGLPSIASLLPKHGDPRLRIILAGRPDPPIPSDVPVDHPIRACRIRPLMASPHARQIAQLAQRELDELLNGEPSDRDLIGLITACGGGLTVSELEDLTGWDRDRLSYKIGGVFGRTIAGRTDPGATYSQQVFLFTHETLRVEAIARLGPSTLARYGDRIHTWAQRYRERSWPADTPPYLLRAYPRMLLAQGDVARLVALTTDAARHDRLLDNTGGDAAAFAEIKAAQDLLLAEETEDLVAMALLAVRRNDLAERNANLPVDLPPLWIALNHPIRAESAARSIMPLARQAAALVRLAAAEAQAGEFERAESIARSIPRAGERAQALREMAGALTAAGRYEHAESIALSIDHDGEQVAALATLVRTLAKGEDMSRARRLLDTAIGIADTISNLYQRARAFIALAVPAALAGDEERAVALVVETRRPDGIVWYEDRQFADLIADLAAEGRARLVGRLLMHVPSTTFHTTIRRAQDIVGEMIAAGDYRRARTLLTSFGQVWPADRVDMRWVWARSEKVVVATAALGDYAPIDELLEDAGTNPFSRAHILTMAAGVPASEGADDVAHQFFRQALDAAATIGDATVRIEILSRLAAVPAWSGRNAMSDDDLAQLRGILARAAEVPVADGALVELAESAVRLGEYRWARDIAAAIKDPAICSRATVMLAIEAPSGGVDERTCAELVATAHDALTSGEHDVERALAVRLAHSAAVVGDDARCGDLLRLAWSDGPAPPRNVGNEDGGYNAVAGTAAVIGELVARGGEVESAAASLGDPRDRLAVLETLARTQVRAGELTAALSSISAAEKAARSMTNGDARSTELVALIEALGVAGKHESARALVLPAEDAIRTVDDAYRRAQLLAALARAAALVAAPSVAHYIDAALGVAHSIDRPYDASQARAAIADALVATDDRVRARTVADAIAEPNQLVRTLIMLIRAAVSAGELDQARQLVDSAVTVARSIENEYWHGRALASVVEASAPLPDRTRWRELLRSADTHARLMRSDYERADVQVSLCEAVAGLTNTGDVERTASTAYATAMSLGPADQRAEVLTRLLRALYAAGQVERAHGLRASIEEAIRSLSSAAQGRFWCAQVEAAVTGPDLPYARALCRRAADAVRSGDDSGRGVHLLARLARATATVSGADASRALVMAAERATSGRQGDDLAEALGVVALACTGLDHGRTARRLLTRALAVGEWRTSLAAVGAVSPEALIAVGEERAGQATTGTW
jgi:tetratricopeptide (TPR) repeat protein